jgi:hypothetical protein
MVLNSTYCRLEGFYFGVKRVLRVIEPKMDAIFVLFSRCHLPHSGVMIGQRPKMAYRFYILSGIVCRRHHGKDQIKCILIILPVSLEEA